MRKKTILLLIIPIILIAIVSCDLDSLSDFMGSMGGNVLLSSGMVTLDTEANDKIIGSISDLFDDAGNINSAKVDEVKDLLKEIQQSPEKLKDFKSKASEPLGNDVDTDDVKDKIEDIIKDLDLGVDVEIEITTKADLLVASLIVSMAESVKDDMTEEEAKDLINDAILVIETINAVSPVGLIDLGSGMKDLLTEFLDKNRGSRATSRDFSDNEFEDALNDFIIPMLKPILKAIDTGKDDTISEEELKVAVRDFSMMRKSYETMAKKLLDDNDNALRKLKFTDQINYALSVVFSIGPKVFNDYLNNANTGFLGFLNDVYVFVMNPDLDDFDAHFGDMNAVGDAFNDYLTDKDKAQFSIIKSTMLNISKSISNNGFLTDKIDEWELD
jgi:hypothetical protein